MKRIILIVLLIVCNLNLCDAQGLGYDSRSAIGNGLYKVKSGEHYGIVDKKDNVVVSVEYQDIIFKDGKALLTRENILYGVVDTKGNIKTFDIPYKVNPKYRYIYDGYIIVGNTIGNTKWGFISADGEPLHIKSKSKKIISLGNKFLMFDDITPFVDGYAAVYNKKSGWKHIDKSGNERFQLSNSKTKAVFRSSVHKGECIIVTNEGAKLYQENNASQAVVKRILSTSATAPQYIEDSASVKVMYNECVLTLDNLMRVTKFEKDGDTIVFIEEGSSKRTAKGSANTLALKEYLKVELLYNDIQANEKGKAYTEVKLVNKSKEKLEVLVVNLECAGATREWSGSINGNSEVKIWFNIPARFSSASINRNLVVKISYGEENIELEYPVTIKRYTPVRSR